MPLVIITNTEPCSSPSSIVSDGFHHPDTLQALRCVSFTTTHCPAAELSGQGSPGRKRPDLFKRLTHLLDSERSAHVL